MGLISWIFGSKKRTRSLVKSYPYTCKWCDYTVYPGEVHFSCYEFLKKYRCEVCTYPIKPGCIHVECKEYLNSAEHSHPFCLICKRVCIPGKPHRDCKLLLAINQANTCECCGFKILDGLDHSYCQKFTILK